MYIFSKRETTCNTFNIHMTNPVFSVNNFSIPLYIFAVNTSRVYYIITTITYQHPIRIKKSRTIPRIPIRFYNMTYTTNKSRLEIVEGYIWETTSHPPKSLVFFFAANIYKTTGQSILDNSSMLSLSLSLSFYICTHSFIPYNTQ